MKRLSLLLLFAFVLTMGVYAGEQAGTDAPPELEEITLTFGVYGDLESAYIAVFGSEDFKLRFPSVTVELQPGDHGGHHNRLVTQIAAGTGSNDVEAIDVGYIARFVQDGGLTNLAPAPYNGMKVGEDLVDFGMSNATTRDGKLVALPVDIAPAVMFYRKSIVDDAGLDMTNIEDWEEFIEKGRKLTVDKDGDGVADQYAIPHPTDLSMIPLNGGKGDWFDGDEPYTPKQRFLDVLLLVQAVRMAGIDANYTPWSGEWRNGIRESKVVTMVGGAWIAGHFKNLICPDLSGDWRVAYPPGHAYSSDGGSYLCIPEQVPDDKKIAAWEIVKYLCTSPEAQLMTFRTTDAFPALTTVFSDPVMAEPVEYFGGQKVRLIYQDISLNIPVQQITEYDAIAKDIFNRAIGLVITDGVPVEQAYQEAKNNLLAQM